VRTLQNMYSSITHNRWRWKLQEWQLLQLFPAGWIIANRCSAVCRTLYCASCSLCRTPLHEWSLARDAVIISHWYYTNSTGYPSESASSSNRHAWFTSHSPGRHLSTWPTTAVSCPTALGVLCSQLTFQLVWCHKHSVVMAAELLQLRDLACGTLFQSSCITLTSPTDCSDDSWRGSFFGKYEHGTLWLLICGAIEKHLLTNKQFIACIVNSCVMFQEWRTVNSHDHCHAPHFVMFWVQNEVTMTAMVWIRMMANLNRILQNIINQIENYSMSQWSANPNRNWDLNQDFSTFGDSTRTLNIQFKRLRFNLRFDFKILRFDLKKKLNHDKSAACLPTQNGMHKMLKQFCLECSLMSKLHCTDWLTMYM